MKKVILTAMFAGALLVTGCKKAKEAGSDLKNATENTANKAAEATKEAANKVADGVKDVAEKAGEMVESALEGVSIPSFSNPAITENLKEYANYAKDYIAAKGNLGKISAMASKGKELLAKGKELTANLDADELKKYKSILSTIQSKMAPSK